MAKSVGVHHAKTNLSRLLEEVARGEEIVITNRGAAVARLVPERSGTRTFGVDAGVFRVPEDFDASLPDDVLADFER